MFLIALTSPCISLGVYGDLIDAAGPAHACKLEVKSGAICSGTFISSKTFKTAAHCLRHVQSEDLKVVCPDGQIYKSEKTVSHPAYVGATDKKQVDVGVVITKTPYGKMLPPIVLKTGDLLKFMETGNCAVWSYGPNTSNLRGVGEFHGVYIDDHLFSESNIILKNPLVFMVQGGDSGGGLYCKDHHGRWLDVGSVYGHDFSESYIVRNDSVSHFLKNYIPRAITEVKSKPAVRGIADEPLWGPILKNTRYKVRAFSMIETVSGMKGIGDQSAVYFTVRKAAHNEGFFIGDLEVLDTAPLRYLCDEITLCNGIYKDVVISADRITGGEKSHEDFPFEAYNISNLWFNISNQ